LWYDRVRPELDAWPEATMPLHDHFHKPLRGVAPWTSLHGAWATSIMGQLNGGLLPKGFVAHQFVSLAGSFQVDVGALHEADGAAANGNTGSASGGGVATGLWAPPAPALSVRVNLTDLDVLEVRVLEAEDMRLVGAIELVSPANKDRPETRAAFISKIGGYLQDQIGVVIVDVVTTRLDNLHNELTELFHLGVESRSLLTTDLYAAAYRTTGKGKRARLDIWAASLSLQQPLPVLPLWIAETQPVRLDLEASYAAACQFAGMSQAPIQDEVG